MLSQLVSMRKPVLNACLPLRFLTSVHDPHAGRIELICGPMFSGKTTELFRRLRRHERAGRSVFLLKFSGDARYLAADSANTEAVTHNNERFPAFAIDTISPLLPLHTSPNTSSTPCSLDTALASTRASFNAAEVIGIDEGQFFPDLAAATDALAAAGKTVVVAALDGDFRREPFPSVAALLPKAEEVTKILAVCKRCGADAPFSARISQETDVVLIGSEDKYMATCRTCYHCVTNAAK